MLYPPNRKIQKQELYKMSNLHFFIELCKITQETAFQSKMGGNICSSVNIQSLMSVSDVMFGVEKGRIKKRTNYQYL